LPQSFSSYFQTPVWKYLASTISFTELKENNTSLILLPEPVIEEAETRKLETRSLDLAGVL